LPRTFTTWLAERDALPAGPTEITRALLEDYRAHVHTLPVSPARRSGHLTALKVFLDDQPAAQAVVQRAPQKRPLAVGVLAQRRQQERRRLREALAQILLLGSDLRDEALGDRDDRLARELVVEELQVGGAGLVGRDRIERQPQAVDRPQPGFDQDHHRGPGREVREPVERLVALELAITNSSTNRGMELRTFGISPR
jgi:hypothetical protein